MADKRKVLLRRGVPIALGGLVITGAGATWALAGESGPEYRTAVASVGSVDQLANFTGTVAKSGRASAAFGVAGTVDQVKVAVGDQVEKGDVLATLDKEDLKAAVRAAKATLAEAEATLASDSSSSGSTGSGASGGSGSTRDKETSGNGGEQASGAKPSPSDGSSGFKVDLTTQVAAVNSARIAATTALDAATEAMTAQAAACTDAFATDSGDEPEPSPSPTSPEGDDAEETDTGPDAADLLKCADALKGVQAAQAKVATAQEALEQAGDALSAAMSDAVKQIVAEAEAAAKQAQQITQQATEQAATIAKEASQAAQQAAQQSASQGSRSGSDTSAIESSARIAVDEAAVTAAEAGVASAEEDLADAVLRAPVAGMVGEVPFTAGSAAAASDAISLLGTGAVEITVEVPLATATTLQKGMAAKVTADGSESPADGTVSTIGVLPDSSSGSSTYPVTILVSDPPAALAEGASAAVAITLKSATDVVTVPNSALTPTGNGSGAFVTLIKNGKPVRQTVTTGTVGETRTEVTEGVTAGETVVLADTAADVPASSTTSTRTGIGGGFPGGGTFAIPSGGGNFGGGARR